MVTRMALQPACSASWACDRAFAGPSPAKVWKMSGVDAAAAIACTGCDDRLLTTTAALPAAAPRTVASSPSGWKRRWSATGPMRIGAKSGRPKRSSERFSSRQLTIIRGRNVMRSNGVAVAAGQQAEEAGRENALRLGLEFRHVDELVARRDSGQPFTPGLGRHGQENLTRTAERSSSASDRRPAAAIAATSSAWTISITRCAPGVPKAPSPQRVARPRHTALAPSASAFITSAPRRNPLSTRTGTRPANRVDDLGQDLERRRPVVERPPAVVRHDDPLRAVFEAEQRVLGRQDALHQHRPGDERADLIQVAPLVPQAALGHAIRVARRAGRRPRRGRARAAAEVAQVLRPLVEGRLLIDGDHDGLAPGALHALEHARGSRRGCAAGRTGTTPVRWRRWRSSRRAGWSCC